MPCISALSGMQPAGWSGSARGPDSGEGLQLDAHDEPLGVPHRQLLSGVRQGAAKSLSYRLSMRDISIIEIEYSDSR